MPRLVRYFVGNREEMVVLLIEGMVERAETALLAGHKAEESLSPVRLIDFLFYEAFSLSLGEPS